MKLRHTQLSIPANGVWLDGMLAHAPDVRALALCLHSHGHPALEQAARPLELALQAAGFATMVVNLLTRQEAQRDPDAPYTLPLTMPNRTVAPMESEAQFAAICQHDCRLVSLGECRAHCRLMARSES